jgi:hypothetical protein
MVNRRRPARDRTSEARSARRDARGRFARRLPEIATDEVRYAVSRAGTLHRLIADGLPQSMAEAWLAAWEERSGGRLDLRRDARAWDEGYAYAVREWAAGRTPPRAPSRSTA